MLKKIIITILLINILLIPDSTAAVNKPLKPRVVLQHPKIPVLDYKQFAVWQNVAICEEGGDWNHFTYFYPNALGINRPNWIQFGGRIDRPSDIATQIEVATRLIQYYNQGIPDQGYCAPW